LEKNIKLKFSMISKNQKDIMLTSKNYIKKNNYFPNVISYFAIFEKTPGSLYLKFKSEKKYFFEYIFNHIKYFFGILNSKFESKGNINFKDKSFKKVIVSWAFRNNFDNSGNYFDKYLKINSSNFKDTIFFLIYMDNNLPKKLKGNIILVYKKNVFLKYNVIFFFSHFSKLFSKHFIGKKFFLNLNSFAATSYEINKIFEDKINLKEITKFFIIYEGQPFQKDIINSVKNINNDIEVVAYDHSAPPPLPLNLIHDNCSPDKLLVTGKAQLDYYSKYLLWPKSKLKIIKTLRFKNEKKNFYLKKFFVPYELYNLETYINSVRALIKSNEIQNFKNFVIQNHPLRLNSNIHKKFISDLNLMLKKSKKNKKTKEYSSVFFGQTTAIIVALELGITCYHICLDPIFDSYSSKFWRNIKVSQLNKNLFKYKLIKKNFFMNINSSNSFPKNFNF
tara:strand:+ start:874 stop:2217 length:1344 start_codon:yes stop_codon:yes gene_type:complete